MVTSDETPNWRLKMGKKIIVIVLSLLLLAGVAGTVWGSSIAQAASSIWNSCPKGKVNDTFPGDCRDYIDTNNDRICDRSQVAPLITTSTITPTPIVLADSSITTAGSGSSAPEGYSNKITADINISTETENKAATGNRNSYYFLPVLATLIVLNSLTWVLSAKKYLKT